MTSKIFRPNVAAVVLDEKGLILACHRSDIEGVWQLPQGGIDPGESEEEALFRELEEEIGTTQFSIIGRLSEKIRYDWPEELFNRGWHGQEQVYFLVRLHSEAALQCDSSKEAEFDKFEWLSAEEFLSRVSAFKKAPYTEAITKLKHEFPGTIKE